MSLFAAVLFVSMFGSMGTGLSGDWGDDALVGYNVLFDGSDIIVSLLWSGSILWDKGCNDKFCFNWLVYLTSYSVSLPR